jgi:glycerophosphoryl diester phosphodiesterase
MPNRPLLLGHRGARATRSIPENTIASFDLALEHGCDGFEFDVRLTKDAAALLCHDPQFGNRDIARSVRSDFPHLALLEEVLERYAQRAFLDIELKVPELEEKVLDALGQHSPKQGFVVSSFFPEILLKLNARNPEIPLGFIADRQAQLSRWRELPVQYVIPNYKLATLGLIEEVQAAKKSIFVWTVNESDAMQRIAAWGADAIISDDTELLVRTLPDPGKQGGNPKPRA